jgi:alpha-L-arabinofuranosidase
VSVYGQAAVAEAGFMTGLERNGQAVEMAAYAPLLVHTKSVTWPTNLIVFDNHRYGSPRPADSHVAVPLATR